MDEEEFEKIEWPPFSRPEGMSDIDFQLFHDLIKESNVQAHNYAVPVPWFSQWTLIEVVVRKPETPDELHAIIGVAHSACTPEFLRLVKQARADTVEYEARMKERFDKYTAPFPPGRNS